MDPISIGMGLLKFAPTIAGWFGGEDAKDKVQKVTEIASAVTGQNNPTDAIKALEANPELALKFEKAVNEYRLAVMQEETKRIAEVNKTMQAEAKSDHWLQWSWRPINGLMFGSTLFGNYFILPLIGKAAIIIPEPILMSWAAILGVAAWTRGQEKQKRLGDTADNSTTSLLGSIKSAVKRGK